MIEDRFNIEEAEYFIDRLFADRKGFVAMAFGHNPRTTKPRFAQGDFRQKYYAWPSERDKLIDDVDDAVNSPGTRRQNIEIFINPALRSKPSRSQEGGFTHAPLMWVWADMDHPPSPDQIEKINALGAMTVLSGTEGHRHVYLPLDAPVSATTHQAMCRALRDIVGGDSKISENDLLRLPGTLNWKTTVPANVVLKGTGRKAQTPRATVQRLTNITGKDWKEYKASAADLISSTAQSIQDIPADHPAPKRSSLHKLVRKAFDNQQVTAGNQTFSRNQAIFELVCVCKEQGMSRADTHALVWTYPPAVEKWHSEWRISNDVDRIWQKAKGPDHASTSFTLSEDDDGTDHPHLQFHTIANLIDRVRNAPAPQFLFEDIVMEGDYGLISAEDKAGKSFVMMDAGISAASGLPWVDKFKTLLPGPVVICVGEGRERKQVRRIMAIGKHKGLTEEQIAALPLHIMLSVPTLKDEDNLIELENKIREVKPVLVIIDPFYLAAAGINLSQINEVGTVLKPLQAIIERHNTALMISHHWNKTGTGDAHSRASGVGLTAWGRFLISIEIKKASTDPTTRKTIVLQEWHMKGDEVMTEKFALEREVWTDSKDPASPMYYRLTLPDGAEVARSLPLKFPTSMEKVSVILSEHLDGLGVRQIISQYKESYGKSIQTSTLNTCLEQLATHGYAQESNSGAGKGFKKPWFHINTFTTEIHDKRQEAIRGVDTTDDHRTPEERKRPSQARARDLDFGSAPDRPRRRRKALQPQ